MCIFCLHLPFIHSCVLLLTNLFIIQIGKRTLRFYFTISHDDTAVIPIINLLLEAAMFR